MAMKKAISSIFKRSLNAYNYRRYFKTSVYCGEKESKVQVGDPFCLERIDYGAHTLRRHNTQRRQTLYEFGLYVAACMPKFVQKIQMQHTDQLEILVAPDGLHPVHNFLRNHQHACFAQCSAVTAIDVPSRVYRFEVVYCLLSFRFAERLRVKTYTDELTPLVSAYSLWPGVNWFEREVYDMFGVIFSHHPDLRRILTDYGFTGHPLRKDFPLVGYIEVRYDDELKKLVYEPVEYAQEFRHYQLESPWNYMTNFHEGYNCPMPKPQKKD